MPLFHTYLLGRLLRAPSVQVVGLGNHICPELSRVLSRSALELLSRLYYASSTSSTSCILTHMSARCLMRSA